LLTAQLTGGLGNQLFTYTRLAHYAQTKNLDFQVDGSVVERVLGHTPDLFDFKLLNEKRIFASDYGKIRVQLERLFWRSSITRKLSRRHQETLLGSENSLAKQLDGWRVRGFFQDFNVANEFLSIFGKDPLSLVTESPSLRLLSEQVRESSTVAIHIRRGDYLDYKDSFGLLSDDYYLEAVATISKVKPFTHALIFSDSPELVVDFQRKIGLESQIISPLELKTSETMMLMSRCAGLITSNSTFSFWAGALADHNSVVIPNPWFKSQDEWLNSSNFRNPKWENCESRWITE